MRPLGETLSPDSEPRNNMGTAAGERRPAEINRSDNAIGVSVNAGRAFICSLLTNFNNRLLRFK